MKSKKLAIYKYKTKKGLELQTKHMHGVNMQTVIKQPPKISCPSIGKGVCRSSPYLMVVLIAQQLIEMLSTQKVLPPKTGNFEMVDIVTFSSTMTPL